MKKNYILIGDSIVYGIGDYDNCGWATEFKKYIMRKDNTKECNNLVNIAAFPGARSYNILDRIDNGVITFGEFLEIIYLEAFDRYFDFKNIVILSIGINDTQCFNGVYSNSKESYKSNLEDIIKKVKDRGFELIILGLTKTGCKDKIEFKPNKIYDNKVILQYDEIVRNICKNNDIVYIPIFNILNDEDFIDGLHPNTNGHKKIYEEIIKTI